MTTLEDAPFLDIFAPGMREEAAVRMAEMREQTWIVRTAIGGLVIGHDEVQALIADRHLRSSLKEIVAIQGLTAGPLFDAVSGSLLAVDGEGHTRLRKLVNRAFTPRAVDRHRGHMRETLAPLIAPLRTTGRTEFMADVAEHYPIQVMCHLLGVPAEDHEMFARWNRSITWALSFELAAHLDEASAAMANLRDYVGRLTIERRREPRDDMVTALAQAEEAGDRLSDTEMQTLIGSLLFAGYDTTRNQLGLAMWLFAENPDQWRLLRERPELAAPAVEEVMRHMGAVGVAPRLVAETFEFGGMVLPAGTMLTLSTASANHDARVHERPDSFDITVPREPHFTFGGGPHYCLGASLARAEMQEALPLLAEAMPEVAVDGEPTWRPPFGIFGPETLPLRFATS